MRAFGLAPTDADWSYLNEGILSPEFSMAPADYFRFSIVRNPWDRFISGWKYCLSTRDRSLCDVLANLPSEGHDYRHLTRPQHEILYDRDGKLVVDFLMRFENLQQDFDQVCDALGKPRCLLNHENKSERSHYSSYFDKESRKVFLQHYRKDIELFDYSYYPAA